MQILSSFCCCCCCCCSRVIVASVPVLLNFSCSAIFGSLGALLIRVFWSRLCSLAQPNFQIAVNFLPAQGLLPCTLCTLSCLLSLLLWLFALREVCCLQKLLSLPKTEQFARKEKLSITDIASLCLVVNTVNSNSNSNSNNNCNNSNRNNDDDIGSNIQYCHNNNLNLPKYFRLGFANFIVHKLTLSCCYCSSSSCCCCCLWMWIWKEYSLWVLHKFTG